MRRTIHLLIVLTVGHVLLISAQVQAKSGVPLLEAAAFGAFARVQGATAAVADGGRSFWSRYLGLRGVAKENETLRTRVLVLEGQVQEQQALLAQTQALQEALAFQRGVALPTLAARVIAGNPSPGAMTVMIDRGSEDGVASDMAVLGSRGLVGRVINRPAPHAAQVQLLIGRSAAVGIKVERTGAGGVAVGGAGDPPLHVDYVPNSADVRAGDRVISSGQDRIYPAGFLVGTVARAERGSETYQLITVQPAVDFSHIDLVLIVLSLPERATAELPAAPVPPRKGPGK